VGNTFSQLHAKGLLVDVCLVSLQVNKESQFTDVTFHFNEATPETDGVLNPTRNTRFMGRGYKMEQNNDVGLTSPPTINHRCVCSNSVYLRKKELTIDAQQPPSNPNGMYRISEKKILKSNGGTCIKCEIP
jgi:hypothetical protein